MDWAAVTGIAGLIIAILTAAGTLLYNWRRSRLEVRQQQFTELTETVRITRAELADTRDELRTTKAELRAAEQRIDELEDENRGLKLRVEELEEENADLKARLGERRRVPVKRDSA